MRWARRSRLTIEVNSTSWSWARNVSRFTTRGLPVTPATRADSKCGTIQRRMSGSGEASASMISTISPLRHGIASFIAMALPSFCCLAINRTLPASMNGRTAARVPSVEASSTTTTS